MCKTFGSQGCLLISEYEGRLKNETAKECVHLSISFILSAFFLLLLFILSFHSCESRLIHQSFSSSSSIVCMN
jgi:hypothetical protein